MAHMVTSVSEGLAARALRICSERSTILCEMRSGVSSTRAGPLYPMIFSGVRLRVRCAVLPTCARTLKARPPPLWPRTRSPAGLLRRRPYRGDGHRENPLGRPAPRGARSPATRPSSRAPVPNPAPMIRKDRVHDTTPRRRRLYALFLIACSASRCSCLTRSREMSSSSPSSTRVAGSRSSRP